jgi:hypothetical protein
MKDWFEANEADLPVEHFVSSQTYAVIVWNRESPEIPVVDSTPQEYVQRLRELPPHTLALWDDETGPAIFGVSTDDVKGAGFEELHHQDFVLAGHLPKWFAKRWNPDRKQTYHLLYKR